MSELYAVNPDEPEPPVTEPPRGALSALRDASLDPVFWPSARPTVASGWHGHVPFAQWVVAVARPEMIVELGTDAGVSYGAFCEAVLRAGLDSRCVAVIAPDSAPSEAVEQGFSAFHDSRYAAFSTLLRAGFDEASEQFEDGSIDLLHLHGRHTYEAVRHDFETWLPKLGERGLVILHDTAVDGGDFGVLRFWEELRTRYPSFAFNHAHGLGLMAVGPEPPDAIQELCALSGDDAERVRQRFAEAGELHELRSAMAIAVSLLEQVRTVPAGAQSGAENRGEMAVAAPPPPAPRRTPRTVPLDLTAGIQVIAVGDAAEPVEGLEDVWPMVHGLLGHLGLYHADETVVNEKQFGMLRDGCFLMPSACVQGAVDRCMESYYLPHRFYYLFDGAEEYFWITAGLDEAYALSTLYFPERGIAVTLRIGGISEAELLEFERLRAAVTKPTPDPVPSNGKRLVVTGFPHFVHTLWNELPALERAAAAGLGAQMRIAAAYSPFGPLLELIPELDCEVEPFSHEDTRALNNDNRLIVGLGALTITQSILARVRDVGVRYTDSAALEERNRFGADYEPVFWLSVQPPPHTFLHQAEVLARLIVLLKQRYPSAGFILNGTSRPWDAATNPNYLGWFNDELAETSTATAEVIDEVMDALDSELREAVRVVSDVSVCEEVAWGATADFYFCHFGAMQNKIGWTQPVPGVVHSAGQFRTAFDATTHVVEDGPPCWLIPARLVEDLEPDPDAERTEAEYRFTSVEDVAQEIVTAFEQSRHHESDRPLGPADTIDK